jgi:exodeoxyribonuclease-3
MKNRKIVSYNLNGIRSATSKGLVDWLKSVDADIVCFQELKAMVEDIPSELRNPEGYHAYWFPAEKKGYSGVGILTKEKPLHVEYGCGIPDYDREGRVLRADFPGYSVISLYLPSGSSGEERQAIKEHFMHDFKPYLVELSKVHPNLVIAGDYNICHQPIDIHDPAGNKKSSGFLPHEREWFGELLQAGFVDSFRKFEQGPHHYTWWSFRAGARSRNKGWRIDYQLVTNAFAENCVSHVIHPDAVHSDHCPIELVVSVP